MDIIINRLIVEMTERISKYNTIQYNTIE